jgi:hypothetical protein
LVYVQDHDQLGVEKLEPMWHGPYIVKQVLKKGAYHLVYYDGTHMKDPCNGLYLKTYYACGHPGVVLCTFCTIWFGVI